MAIEGLKQELLENRARALSGIESFGIISVQTRGNAAEVGLEESQLTDYLRLKFKNNFAGVKFHDLVGQFISDETGAVLAYLAMLSQNEEEAKKVGTIRCFVWTVGKNDAVAYHVWCEAGDWMKGRIWDREVLGFDHPSKVALSVKNDLRELIENFAVVFFKARGEM